MPERKIAVGVLVNNDALGGRLADMLAAYAYDWWLQTENVEADYAKLSRKVLRPLRTEGAALSLRPQNVRRESGNLQSRLVSMPESIGTTFGND